MMIDIGREDAAMIARLVSSRSVMTPSVRMSSTK